VSDDSNPAEPREAPLAEAVRARLAAGEVDRATTLIVQTYGPQILGYLTAMARVEADAHDAFSQFCEDLWRGLAGFRWRSSLRTWSYTLARHALHRQWAAAPQRHGPHVGLSEAPELAALAARARTTTLESARTDARSRFAALRDALDPDDRTLLILRVDRRMAWRDIAEVLGEDPDPAAIQRRCVALRKRFERLKESLGARLRAPPDE
jgi:RNA polymerase sigma-70 factor (ECF subfamily)